MTFKDTADPEKLTVDDVARWSEELAKTIRENPTNPRAWRDGVASLYRKINAIRVFYPEEPS